MYLFPQLTAGSLKMNFLRVLIFIVALPCCGQIGRTVDKDSIIRLQKSAIELSQLRKFNKALTSSHNALKYASYVENDSLIAESYRTLGVIYIRMQHGALAIENYKNAIPHYERSNNRKGLMKIHNNIGYYLFKNGSYEAAEKQLRISLELSKEFPGTISSIYPKYNIGQLYLTKKEYEKSADCFQKVIAYCTNGSYYPKKSKILETARYFLGLALVKQQKIIAAKDEFEQAVAICNSGKQNHTELLSLLHEELAKIHTILGDEKAALEALEKHVDYYEKDNIESKAKTLEEIILKYGIEEYEGRLEAIEDERIEKEFYIDKYKKLLFILIIILFVLALLTGFFYLNQRLRVKTNILLSAQNRQLFEAKKQIENVSKIRSNFFSLISHELRTPLYAIIGMTNLLLLEKPEAFQERYLKSLKFSGEHLLAIINNILQMNKIEASKMNIIEDKIDLQKSIKNVITSISFLMKENGNQIHVFIDEEIPEHLLGDSLKISQILFNILDNAARYTLGGNINLAVHKINETQETVLLKFSIQDDGLGIPQQKKHVIFEHLEEGVVLHEGNGYLDLGLGLTTVNNLLRVLKSKLYLKSVLNKGSEFYFELEIKKAGSEKEEDEIATQRIYDFKNINVLIVDDNAVNGLLTQKILEKKQIQTKVVHSGFSAIDILDKQSFDLVLMDMFMPKLNGIETIERIRESDNHIPIILLTAMEITDAYAKVVNTEISGVISKPFEPEMLYDNIQAIINQNSEV